jgi:xanthine dehydrogenase accessory factor
MSEWAGVAKAALARGEPVALITLLAVEGSAPRGAGTRMLVTADTIGGTIGGGNLELQAIRQGRAVLEHPPGTWRVQDYPLGPLLAQCCGGRVRLLVERLDPAESGWIGQAGVLATRFTEDRLERRLLDDGVPASALSSRGDKPAPGDEVVEHLGRRTMPVMLFGAGHVGSALARALQPLPVQLAWFDSRKAEAEATGAAFVPADDLPACLSGASAEVPVLIMTHDHNLDYALTSTALKSPAAFVGLIGSATKRARFLSRLAKDGVDASRLTCPIGVPGVKGKEPAIIAVAVAAQLMQLYGAAA